MIIFKLVTSVKGLIVQADSYKTYFVRKLLITVCPGQAFSSLVLQTL
jgi:hypothetical protein